MRLAIAAAVAAMATAGGAHANSLWAQHPQAGDIEREYPKAARKAREPGVVKLTCKATAEYRLDACVVASEEPAGLGFGEAALKLTPKFKLRKVVDGKPIATGTIVTVPIRFDLN